MSFLSSTYRSHDCGELRADHAGKVVKLSGWIASKRDHGGVLFVDLRDHYGVTQVVFHGDASDLVDKVRIESVIEIEGEVKLRGADLANPKLPTGEIEVASDKVKILSEAKVLPFLVAEDDNAPEVQRLKSRFLELRRQKLHDNIITRSKVISSIRSLMEEQGFTEFQTPILTSSSPEGARDFIVPSRLHPGKFYALPQAPQQFKQLLMISGFDRYFQIAPCFRDEDARADRSPGEFYQLDVEMSFVEREDVFAVNEKVMSQLFSKFSDWQGTDLPFPKIPYHEAIAAYGIDKPDLRNPLKIAEVTESFANTDFRVFQNIIAEGGNVYVIKITDVDAPSRKYFDDLINQFTKNTGLGLGYLVVDGDEFKGSFQKLVKQEEVDSLKEKLEVKNGIIFLAAGKPKELLPHLGRLRIQLGQDFDLLQKDQWSFCWITDFPFYEEHEETGAVDFGHNPFSMPQGGLEALENEDPFSIKAFQYDLVLNGNEIASGAIRNHDPEIMYKAFAKVGYSKEVVDDKFGGLLNAFTYGAPPHGGIAYGLDRIVMLICGEEAIRDVVAFPLAQNGEDLLMGAPSEVFEQQLREVHIEVNLPEEEVQELLEEKE